MALLGAGIFHSTDRYAMEDLGFNYTRCLEGLRTTNLTVSHVTSKLPGDMRNLVPIGRGEPQGGAPHF